MRVSLSFFAAVPAIVSSAILPTRLDESQPATTAPPSAVLELELDKDQPKALFRVPCNGCLGHDAEASAVPALASDDEAFLFDFQAFPSEEPCGVSNVTVNGVTLAQLWNGPESSGQGSFRSVPSGSILPQHELGLTWESACLYGNESESDLKSYHEKSSQVITVTIQTVNGKSVKSKAGFTISFKPVIPLELLRLSIAPDATATKPGNSEAWRDPPEHLRLTPVGADVLVDEEFEDPAAPANPTLQQHIKELKALEAKEAEIRELINQKKQIIKEHIKEDIKDFKTELRNCGSVSCVFKTILAGAKGAIKVVYYKLKPDRPSFGQGEGDFVPITQSTQQFSEADISDTSTSTDSESSPPPRPRPTGFHFPTWSNTPLMIALEVLLSATGLAALFACLRNCLCVARCRQACATSREERRNVRAYRRAARRHRWRRWIYGRDQERMDDYEEKRALIRDQEDILETAMQDEIRLLREAHNVVNSIVRAEEGRGFRPTPVTGMSGMPILHPHPHRSVSSYVHAHMVDDASGLMQPRPLSRTNSLPEYQSDAASLSEPPAYEEDEDSSDVVPDGFREYTPSGSSAGPVDHTIGGSGEPWTPRSSVITTSPRPSLETLESRRFEDLYERATRSRSSSCSSSQFGGSEKSV